MVTKITRYATVHAVEKYEFVIDEEYANQLNMFIKEGFELPNFENLTVDDISAIFTHTYHYRENEALPRSNRTLGSIVRMYVEEDLWENEKGFIKNETIDWEDIIENME